MKRKIISKAKDQVRPCITWVTCTAARHKCQFQYLLRVDNTAGTVTSFMKPGTWFLDTFLFPFPVPTLWKLSEILISNYPSRGSHWGNIQEENFRRRCHEMKCQHNFQHKGTPTYSARTFIFQKWSLEGNQPFKMTGLQLSLNKCIGYHCKIALAFKLSEKNPFAFNQRTQDNMQHKSQSHAKPHVSLILDTIT